MKVEEGDVLICSTEDCEVDLTVTRTASLKPVARPAISRRYVAMSRWS